MPPRSTSPDGSRRSSTLVTQPGSRVPSGQFTFSYDMSRDNSSDVGHAPAHRGSNPAAGGSHLGYGDHLGGAGVWLDSTSPVGSSSTPGPASAKGKVDMDAEAKRRKIQRACDACRRKKIRCDGPMNSLSTSKCAHCEEFGLECTYVEAAKRRGPPKGYVETLEQRCGRLERLLTQLHPGTDFNDYVGPPLDREEFDQVAYQETLKHLHIPPYPKLKPFTPALQAASSRASPADHSGPISGSASSLASTPAANLPVAASTVLGPTPWGNYERDPHRPPDDPEEADGGDAAVHAEIARAMNRLDIQDGSWRFHGKASAAHLLRLFSDLKYKKKEGTAIFLESVNRNKRPEYWHVPEWEVVIANEGVKPIDYSIWPPVGFDKQLINSYFDMVNFHLPLLNKTIFLRQYDSGLYRSNHEFAKVCLMVFANGARFVDDERVYWPRDQAMTEEGKERLRLDKDGTIKYSAGWNFLRAIMRMGRSIVQGPNLYDFQTQVLVCAFFQGAAIPHLTWVISGLGLRSAQEIGIHVRSTLMLANPVERALYNRAFWCLYHIDRTNCAAIGRSVALQDTDFDADYPIAVDDEYWDTGDREKNFVQPEGAGVPKVAAFIHMLKLDHVIGAALRTIYAINRQPENRSDLASQRSVVVELDSALNSWADSVPDGLRWDPTRSDQQLFAQSAILYSQYYFCQILVHRPFIPTPKSPETIGLPSLAICSNASRSISNILDAVLRRGRQYGALPGQAISVHFLLPAWTAAVVLLVSIYTGRQVPAEKERAMKDVKRCIAALKEMELTWRQAGKLTDMLTELASEKDAPMPRAETRMAEKREFGSASRPESTGQSTPDEGSVSAGRKISGSRVKGSVSSQRAGSGSGSQASFNPAGTGADGSGTVNTNIAVPDAWPAQRGLAQSCAQPQQTSGVMPSMPFRLPNNPSDSNPTWDYFTDSTAQGRSQSQAAPSQFQQQSSHSQAPSQTFQQPPAFTSSSSLPYNPSEPLWDSTFFDALNPELFGMSDIGMDSLGLGGMGLGMNADMGGNVPGTGFMTLPGSLGGDAGGVNHSGAGASGGGNEGMGDGTNVDDLWAQLFSGYSQGIWTPNERRS